MKRFFFIVLAFVSITSCKLNNTNQTKEDNKELSALLERYYEERLKLFPLEATTIGDTRYNNLLPVDFTDSYRDSLRAFYNNYKVYISKYDRETLNENDKISYDIFKREMEMSIEGLSYHDNYIPFQQFWGLPLTLGQLGSGEGSQPFKTVKDFDDWVSRASGFSAWTDSAIVYFRKGIAANYVLPQALVAKMIPQMEAMQTTDATKSLFYGPVNKIPANTPDADKQRLTASYVKVINEQIVPSYKKLADFLKNEYLPKARSTSGISALSDGDKYYNYLIRYWTTTNKTPDEIYNTGLS